VLRVLGRDGYPGLTVEAVAAEAGVSKQTIYRWWTSRAEIVLEATTDAARAQVPLPDTGVLGRDVEAFLSATYQVTSFPVYVEALRALAAEAQREPAFRVVFQQFTRARRDQLRVLLERGRDRGELAPDAPLDVLVDLAFGIIWYRLLVGHAEGGEVLAGQVTRRLVAPLR
jgi:AcrR family transcriptional regulator